MRELNVNEINEVNGGVDELIVGGLAITSIGAGLTAFAVGTALVGAFSAGYWLGTVIYDWSTD